MKWSIPLGSGERTYGDRPAVSFYTAHPPASQGESAGHEGAWAQVGGSALKTLEAGIPSHMCALSYW